MQETVTWLSHNRAAVMTTKWWTSTSCLRCFYWHGNIQRLVEVSDSRHKVCPVCCKVKGAVHRDDSASVWTHAAAVYFAEHGQLHPVCLRAEYEQKWFEEWGSVQQLRQQRP